MWIPQQGSSATAATKTLCLMHKNMKQKLSDRRILQSESVIFQLSVPTKWNIVEELVTQR